jgi:hypothetical protein
VSGGQSRRARSLDDFAVWAVRETWGLNLPAMKDGGGHFSP